MNEEILPIHPSTPAWRLGMFWLVVGGPLAVVLASFLTLWLALTHPDPIVSEAQQSGSSARAHSMTPAVQARNHAGTAP